MLLYTLKVTDMSPLKALQKVKSHAVNVLREATIVRHSYESTIPKDRHASGASRSQTNSLLLNLEGQLTFFYTLELRYIVLSEC